MDWYFIATLACTGFGVAAAARLAAEPVPELPLPPLERRRRDALRRRSFVYRHLPSLAAALARTYPLYGRTFTGGVAASLAALGEDDWRPEEYVSTRHVGLIPKIAGATLLAAAYRDLPSGLLFGAVLFALAPLFVAWTARRDAEARLRAIRGRLPYTLDLVALVVEAGGGLFDGLRLGAEENPGHPLGEELRRVVGAIEQGAAPVAVLDRMGRRLDDPDVTEVCLTAIGTEEQGLPPREALRAVAARLRSRALHAMERAAEQAKVSIIGPEFVVMLACLAVVAAPYAIEFLTVGDRWVLSGVTAVAP